MGNKKKKNSPQTEDTNAIPKLTDEDIKQILKKIEQILKSDAKIEHVIIDDRFHNIRQLVSKVNRMLQKNEKKRRNQFHAELIELINNYIQQLHTKKFNTVDSQQNDLLIKANRNFVIRLLKYISATLKTYPNTNSCINISSSPKTLDELIKNENAPLNLETIITPRNQK